MEKNVLWKSDGLAQVNRFSDDGPLPGVATVDSVLLHDALA